MLVKVFKLGNEEEIITTFTFGSHVIGRGPVLQCNDKRVSRNHAELEITPNDIKLTSLHINPCFLKASNSKTLTVLSRNSSTQLNDGDAFAFLPEDYWFKIRIVDEDVSVNKPQDNEASKRPIEETEEDQPPDKKAKIAETDNKNEDGDVTVEATSTSNNIAATDVDEAAKNESDTSSKPINEAETEAEPDQSKNDATGGDNASKEIPDNNITNGANENVQQNAEITSSQDVKQEVEEQADDGTNPSTSNPKPRREKCWYGAECYRKNPVHRNDYTHPGDSDFESDPDDNRPTCSFGASCYRKNMDHRRNYKHPPGKPPSKKKRTRKKVNRLNVANSEDMKDLDLSDSEDPFIVDDDSDEYEENSDEDDTDWEDSQDVDEDSENLKRLVKEANKFAKK